MPNNIKGTLLAVLSAVLPLGPACWFGLAGKPTEMGLAVLAGGVAAAFLNLDKIQRFKGGGFEAEMREIQKAKDDVYATIENLRQVAKPVLESTVQMLTISGRLGGLDVVTKHRYRNELERVGREIGIADDRALQSAHETFFRMHTWDHYSALIEHIGTQAGVSETVQENLRSMRQSETRNANQHLGEVGVNAPVMRVVGVGQDGPGHATAETHMVQLAAHRPQACLDIAKTLAVSQLSEGHCQILVATREASVVRITAVAGYTLLKLVGGQMLHQLGENSLAEIHLSLSAIATGARRTAFRTVFVGKNSIGMDLIQWEMRAVGLRLLS